MTTNFDYSDKPTIESEKEQSQLSRLVDKTLDGSFFKNATIIPGKSSQIDEKYWGEAFSEDGNLINFVNSNNIYPNDTIKLPDRFNIINKTNKSIIYLGAITTVWGHYITDGLSKLWFLQSSLCHELINKGYVVALTGMYSNVSTCPNSFDQLLSLLNIDSKSLLFITEIMQFNDIYIPDNSIFIENGTRFCTKEYSKIIKQIITAVPFHEVPLKHKKIYLSRTHLTNKHTEFGELAIENLFKSLGFYIIYPEQYSLIEQINLYNQAQIVATTEGSIAHNVVFCSEATEIFLLRKAYYTNDYQYIINTVRNLNVTYIDAHLSVFTSDQPNMGPFFMYVNDNLMRFVKDKFGTNISKNFSKQKFYQYSKKCIKLVDFYNRRSCPEYYFQKLYTELNVNKSLVQKLYAFVLNIMPNKIRCKVKVIVNKFVR